MKDHRNTFTILLIVLLAFVLAGCNGSFGVPIEPVKVEIVVRDGAGEGAAVVQSPPVTWNQPAGDNSIQSQVQVPNSPTGGTDPNQPATEGGWNPLGTFSPPCDAAGACADDNYYYPENATGPRSCVAVTNFFPRVNPYDESPFVEFIPGGAWLVTQGTTVQLTGYIEGEWHQLVMPGTEGRSGWWYRSDCK